MIYHKVDQRSPEWFALRIGKPTASEFSRLLTPKTAKLSSQSVDYAHQILAEMMLGAPLDTIETPYMMRGQELEDGAIDAYEFVTGLTTSPGGFCTDDAGRYGCSPDRMVGDDGVLEMKCPGTKAHIGYLLAGTIEGDYRSQIQGELLVTERKWADVVSYYPALPPVIKRVYRDEKFIESLREVLESFCDLLLDLRQKLESQYGAFPEIRISPKPSVDPDDALGISDAEIDELIARGAIDTREVK